MRSYTIKTHANREFDHDFSYVTVIDSHYEDGSHKLVLDIEVDEINENRYQRELENDSAVYSYVCNDVFDKEALGL